MKIKLKRLTLENFKGIKNFDLEINGDTANVLGANRSGKTTISDAYNWLLFNKDSLNKSDFGIKTLDKGEVVHGLEHSVEGLFEIDGKEVTLKKTFKEKWTKKRGSSNKEMTGHVTDYEINDIPKKKKDFDEYVKSIVEDPKIFRLVSDPLYFNSLNNDEKRDILMEISGEIEDEVVIETNENLKDLNELLKNFTIEELHAKNKRDKKSVNQRLKENPVRIDEISKGIEELPEGGIEDYQKKAKDIDEEIETINAEITSLKNGGQAIELKQEANSLKWNIEDELQRKIKGIEFDMDQYIRNFDEGSNERLRKLRFKDDADKSNLSIVSSNVKRQEEQLENQDKYTQDLREDYAEIAEKLKEVESERKEFEIEETCSCCGQRLPEDRIESHREKQQQKYNEERAAQITTHQNDLEALGKKGKESANTVENLKAELEKTKDEKQRLQEIIDGNERQIQELEKDVVEPKDTDQYKEFESQLNEKKELLNNIDTEIFNLSAEYKEVSDKLENLESSTEEAVEQHQVRISKLRESLAENNSHLSKFEKNKRDQERIEELMKEQEKLADEYEELESLEDKLNEFTTTKVNLVEDRISNKFKHARFQLFEKLLNGGLEEKCVTLFEGVPYDKGLNTEAKINVGLDIINTLSDHYNFIAPIIIDNSESVSELFDTDAQQIRLIVSKNHKELTMEVA